MYQYDKRLDFHALGREIKRKREEKGWTQDYLSQLVDRTPRSIMYIENRGQHPSLNTFYQLVTLLDISVDQFFFPDKLNGESTCRKQIDVMLNSMDEKELIVMESTAEGLKKARGTEEAQENAASVFLRDFGGCTKRQAIRVWAHSIFSRPRRARENACWGAPQSPGASACCLRPVANAPGPYFFARPYGRADDPRCP